MMSEAEALREGYAMLDDHDDEEWPSEVDDEFDGFTIEDEDGYIVAPDSDADTEQDAFDHYFMEVTMSPEEANGPFDPVFGGYYEDDSDTYDDGPESTAEPEGW